MKIPALHIIIDSSSPLQAQERMAAHEALREYLQTCVEMREIQRNTVRGSYRIWAGRGAKMKHPIDKHVLAQVALFLLLWAIPCLCTAETVFGEWTYRLNDEGQAIIVGYNGAQQNVTLPWNLDGHLVTEIDGEAFAGN